MAGLQQVQLRTQPFGAREMILAGTTLADALKTPYEQALARQKFASDQRVQDAQIEKYNMELAQAKQAIADKAANIAFGSAVLDHHGKDYSAAGDWFNSNADAISKKVAPTIKDNTGEIIDSNWKKSYDNMNPANKALMDAQENLSKMYDAQSRNFSESEKIANVLNERRKNKEPITQEMLAALAGAKKAEEDAKQAEIKSLRDSGKASIEKGENIKIKALIENIKNDNKTNNKSNKDGSPASHIKDLKALKTYTDELSVINLPGSDASKAHTATGIALEHGYNPSQIMGAITKAGGYDSRFDQKLFAKALSELNKNTTNTSGNKATDIALLMANTKELQGQQALEKANAYPKDMKEEWSKMVVDRLNNYLASLPDKPTTERESVVKDSNKSIVGETTNKPTNSSKAKSVSKAANSVNLKTSKDKTISNPEMDAITKTHNETIKNQGGNWNPLTLFNKFPDKKVSEDKPPEEVQKEIDNYSKIIRNQNSTPQEKIKAIQEKNKLENDIKKRRPWLEQMFEKILR